MIDDDKRRMDAATRLMGTHVAHFERNLDRLPELHELPGVVLGLLGHKWERLSEDERGALAVTAAALLLHSRKPGAYFAAWLRAVGRLVLSKLRT